jgi:hypothetical protein
MANETNSRRAGLGFQGGQVLALRLTEDALTTLRNSLQSTTERWQEVQAVDGAVLIDLEQVVFLRVESDDHRVGF